MIGGELIELADTEFSHPLAAVIMEDLRRKLAAGFGVTVQGPYVTLRWGGKYQITMLAINLTSNDERAPVETPQ